MMRCISPGVAPVDREIVRKRGGEASRAGPPVSRQSRLPELPVPRAPAESPRRPSRDWKKHRRERDTVSHCIDPLPKFRARVCGSRRMCDALACAWVERRSAKGAPSEMAPFGSLVASCGHFAFSRGAVDKAENAPVSGTWPDSLAGENQCSCWYDDCKARCAGSRIQATHEQVFHRPRLDGSRRGALRACSSLRC